MLVMSKKTQFLSAFVGGTLPVAGTLAVVFLPLVYGLPLMMAALVVGSHLAFLATRD